MLVMYYLHDDMHMEHTQIWSDIHRHMRKESSRLVTVTAVMCSQQRLERGARQSTNRRLNRRATPLWPWLRRHESQAVYSVGWDMRWVSCDCCA